MTFVYNKDEILLHPEKLSKNKLWKLFIWEL